MILPKAQSRINIEDYDDVVRPFILNNIRANDLSYVNLGIRFFFLTDGEQYNEKENKYLFSLNKIKEKLFSKLNVIIDEIKIVDKYIYIKLQNSEYYIIFIILNIQPTYIKFYVEVIADLLFIEKFNKILNEVCDTDNELVMDIIKYDGRGVGVFSWTFVPRYTYDDIKDFYIHIPNLDEAQDFFNQESKMMYFLGEKGMGKTRLVEGLLGTWNKRGEIAQMSIAYVLQSEAVLNPEFWANYYYNIIILEDADILLGNREHSDDVNSLISISNLLRISDGLLYDYSPYFIFISNYPALKIDEALLREGRVFGYYEFEPYPFNMIDSIVESVASFLKVDINPEIEERIKSLKQRSHITLAQIFALFKGKRTILNRKRFINKQRKNIGFF